MKKITLLIIVSLLSFCGYAQLPNESFEQPWVANPGYPDAPPGGWIVLKESPDVYVTWARRLQNLTTDPPLTANSGEYYALLEKEGVCGSCAIPKNWLITKSFPNPANGQGQLRFNSKLGFLGVQGSIYKVKIFREEPGKDPYNFADYTDLVTYTEDQLNTFQQTWTEKTINMPNFTGNIRIAFIMEGSDKDRWLIDDVSVTSPCAIPTNITVGDMTLTTATINWVSTSNATTWEINVVPSTASGPAAGNWKTYNGATTQYVYGLQPDEILTPDSNYIAYIRAVCADGGRSAIANPVYFSTAALGEKCSDPLVIGSLPFTTTNNTNNFANNYLGVPGTGCSTTATYLQGNDVVYQYIPTFTGTINVSLTNNSANTGMFIYANCAAIGNNCITGGTVGGTAGPIVLTPVSVTINTPIYIVISSNASVASTPYTLTIQQIFCAPPGTPSVTAVSPTSASLSWPAGTATEWQVAVRPAGTQGLPTGGQTVTTATPTVSATTAPAAGQLNASTSYEYYVRASCGDGTYSIWIGPFAFTTTQNPALLNFTDNFETLPSQWTLNNGTQANKWAINPNATVGSTSGGTGNALFISNDNGLNNLYTITTASIVQAYRDVTIPSTAASLNLSFDWKGVGQTGSTTGDFLRVYLAPTNLAITPGTAIPTTTSLKIGNDLSNSPVWTTSNNIINLPAGVAGTQRRLIFEWVNNAATGTQTPAAIDNVNLSVITCPAPPTAATLQAGTLAPTSVGLQFAAATPVPSGGYDVYLGPSSTQPGPNPVSVPGTTIVTNVNVTNPTITGLVASQGYYVWIRSNCGTNDRSTWTGPLFIVAPQVPAGMDYTQNFDGATHEWTLNNGTQTNKWVVGNAVNNGGTKSLYISNDNGVTNNYNNLTSSWVQAYRDIQMPTAVDQLELSFDWKNVGETGDYFRVWLVDTDYTLIPGTPMGTGGNRLLIPTTTSFINQATWTKFTYIVQGNGYANTTKRLVFEWINNNANGASPAAIDNISLKIVPCPQPSAPLLSGMTASDVNFTWTAPASGATAYNIYYGTDTTTPPANPAVGLNYKSTTAASGVFSTADGLQPSSTYYFWVRTDCGTSKSYWVGPVKFVTPQIPAPMDYSENFDGPAHGYQLMNDNQVNKWVVGNATSNSAPNSLYVSNNNGVNNAYSNNITYVQAYRDIQLPAAVTDVQLTFDWKGTGDASDNLRVWMVPIDYVPVAGSPVTGVANSRIQVGTAFYNNAGWKTENFIFNVNQFQGQVRRLVFEWVNNGTTDYQRPSAIDNVRLASVTCYPPTNLTMPSNNAGGATFAWTAPVTGTPTSYEYYYNSSMAAPVNTTVASGATPTPSVTLAGLPPSSNFYFWVRSNCGTNSKSVWVGPIELNTAQQASPLPYVQNFDGITHGWTLTNGTQQNKWTVGAAVSNSPNKSLYISDTNGETNNYNINITSYAHAYKDFIIPSNATSLDFSFMWKGAGSTNDFLRVYRVPTSYKPTAGQQIVPGSLPTGSQQIAAGLRNSTVWTSASYLLDPTGANGYAGTNQRFIFEWSNDAFTGPQAPAAIDNVDLQVVTCPKPVGLSVNGITSTGATFNWT